MQPRTRNLIAIFNLLLGGAFLYLAAFSDMDHRIAMILAASGGGSIGFTLGVMYMYLATKKVMQEFRTTVERITRAVTP